MKIFAFDMDGTLLQSNMSISPATLNVLNTIVNNNHKLLLVTGRHYELVKPIVEKYNLDCGSIVNSGHQYFDDQGIERRRVALDQKTVINTLRVLLAHDFLITIHTDMGKYILEDKEAFFAKQLALISDEHRALFEDEMDSPFLNKEFFFKDLKSTKSIDEFLDTKAQVLKIDARAQDKDKLDETVVALEAISSLLVHVTYDGFIEISSNASNKGLMLKDVVDSMNVEHNNVYVFGDSQNDQEMFEHFENSIAMENAHPNLKAQAKWITKTNDEDGIVHAYHHLLNF
ncbi:MAG: Cof-type HAD-IIB family hydrolase [Erysipelothrix sp.]|nr:Cof-type HAD-IIB family hydrolase [Erysipelothrix sp.]